MEISMYGRKRNVRSGNIYRSCENDRSQLHGRCEHLVHSYGNRVSDVEISIYFDES